LFATTTSLWKTPVVKILSLKNLLIEYSDLHTIPAVFAESHMFNCILIYPDWIKETKSNELDGQYIYDHYYEIEGRLEY